jgi:hypothetical protein
MHRARLVTAVAITVAVLLASGGPAHAAAPMPALPALPPGWPALLHLGLADPPGGATALRAGAPFGFRYSYLAGGVNTGAGWTTWDPSFIVEYIHESIDSGVVPVFTYYMLRQSAPGNGLAEVDGLAVNLLDAMTMRAYFEALTQFYQQAGSFPGQLVILHAEPDLWGHAQQSLGPPGGTTFAHIASTGLPELAGLPDSIAGLAQAFARLRDLHAPNVQLAYHLSAWGTGQDFRQYDDAGIDGLATQAAQFMASLGAPFDVVFAEFSDRDAGFKQYVEADGGAAWWGPVDFARHVRFLSTFVTTANRRVVLWQIPLGNTRMRAVNDTWGHYQDNRVEWLLDDPTRTHLDAYRRAGVVAFLFGPGAPGTTCACDATGDGVTNPVPINGNVGLSLSAADDGGFFRWKASDYYAPGAMPLLGAGGRDLAMLAFDADPKTVARGEVLQVSFTIANPGPADVVDVYLGLRLPPAVAQILGCPTGDLVLWFADGFRPTVPTCFSTAPLADTPTLAHQLVVGVALPATEFALTAIVPPGMPPGEYWFVLAFTAPGALGDGRLDPGDLVAATLARFTVVASQ